MNQHLVSKVIIKRFAGGDGQVAVLDLDSLNEDTAAPKDIGAVLDLLDADAAKMEARWNQQVESRLSPSVFAQIETHKPITDDKVCETLRRCIALHWARGNTVIQLLERTRPQYDKQIADNMLAQFSPEDVLRELSGGIEVVAVDTEEVARARIAAKFDAHLHAVKFQGRMFQDAYENALVRTRKYQIQLVHAPDDEFLLGDVPVINLDSTDLSRVGALRGGVTWDASDKLFMVFDKGEESKTETYSYVVKSSKGNEVELEGTDESGKVLKGKAEFKGDSLILTRQDMPGSLVLKKK